MNIDAREVRTNGMNEECGKMNVERQIQHRTQTISNKCLIWTGVKKVWNEENLLYQVSLLSLNKCLFFGWLANDAYTQSIRLFGVRMTYLVGVCMAFDGINAYFLFQPQINERNECQRLNYSEWVTQHSGRSGIWSLIKMNTNVVEICKSSTHCYGMGHWNR